MKDFNLHKLPPCGKLFVGFFCIMVLLAMIWMAAVQVTESSLFVPYESEPYIDEDVEGEAIEFEEDMDITDAETPPEWEDSGQQEEIGPEDTEYFEEEEPEEFEEDYEYSGWVQFIDNLQWSLMRLATFALLYFAVGLLFFFTTYSYKSKKFLYWFLGIFIILFVISILGYGFCWTAMYLTHFCGSVIAFLMFIMALLILVNLKAKEISEQ